MTPLRQQMIAALQRSGTGKRTQQSSVRAVRLRAQCSGTSPAVLSAQALQASCLHRNNVDGLAPASLRLCSSGIRCFSPHVLTRDWSTLALWRAHTTRQLPAVRRVEEGKRLLAAATPCHNHAYVTTVYRLGLRLHAARSLQVADLDGQRLQVHVHRGQDTKDRDVPVPADTLPWLRPSWKTPRHPTWLFPAPGGAHTHSPTAASPMRRASVQGACRTAQHRAGSTKMGVAIHPLRHAYATPRPRMPLAVRPVAPRGASSCACGPHTETLLRPAERHNVP